MDSDLRKPVKGSLQPARSPRPTRLSLHSRAREYLLIQRDECYNPIDKIAWPVVEGFCEGKPRAARRGGGGLDDGIMGIPQEDEAEERIRDLKRSLN
jgi:hypothetical protein